MKARHTAWMRMRSTVGAIWIYIVVIAIVGTPLYAVVATSSSPEDAESWLVFLMFAPATAALIAWAITRQRPLLGRPRWSTLLMALIPPVIVGVAYAFLLLGPLSWKGTSELDSPFSLVFNVAAACVLAFGEELGWRGYLLPLLRRKFGFFAANTWVVVLWLLFHLPVIVLGGGAYSNADIPMWANIVFFSLAIAGFSFFVGLLWEIHHDVWSATLAHGWWNTTIQSTLPAMFLAGSPWVMGEFGLVAAGCMSILLIFVIIVARARVPAGPAQLSA